MKMATIKNPAIQTFLNYLFHTISSLQNIQTIDTKNDISERETR